MSALNRFEEFMEGLVEDSVARLFRSPVQPAEIAKRLERAMESNQRISVRRVIVPSIYRVFLNPGDFAVFSPKLRSEVEREMATYLSELADERKFTLLAQPQVTMAEDASVPRRTIQVITEEAEATSSTQVMSATRHAQAGARTQRATLLLTGNNGVHPIPLETTLLTIGRGLNNDIILEDTRVSRHHAQLRYRARRFWITDLNSSNGTYINGERVNEADLRNGDIVSLGGLELSFQEG
ncbi:MAG: DUF3662 domain-containing protein [Chloroflexaceae bacterium]|nr:DUF3662 domain-containing protein [Chloroflexaceae bacterium]NJO06603.1 DUF3662 domain-containing protein [Chloroflexaceae bacterium]